MRCAWLAWLIAGCGFSSPSGPPGDPVGDPGGGSGSGSGSGAPTSAMPCDVSDAQIRLCLSFGGDHMAQDLATPPHAVVDVAGIAPIIGIVSSAAGSFGINSHLRFGETADFDVRDLTLELWISPLLRPGKNKRFWLLDNNTQYYATYEEDGSVRCGIGGASVVGETRITPSPGSWHHVACTYAASERVLRTHVDGSVAGCDAVNSIPQGGNDGVAIGANFGAGKYTENFVGSLDAVHLYARALSPGELCDAAGSSDCSDRCPDQGPSLQLGLGRSDPRLPH
ncbi:MAG TPA: LamG domain-containing protein [Kofleriaceae bacterium]|nr:LamG domain-containing protein [Kofleriaceae bacterium]